jgi:hypothetical protein
MCDIYFNDKDLIQGDIPLKKFASNKKKNEDNLLKSQKEIIKKNIVIKEKIIIVDKIVELYPNLKRDKQYILDYVLDNKLFQKKSDVLEKLNIKNKNIYMDSSGNLIDKNIKLVGFWKNIKDENENNLIKYIFFDETKKMKNKILKNIKKFNM